MLDSVLVGTDWIFPFIGEYWASSVRGTLDSVLLTRQAARRATGLSLCLKSGVNVLFLKRGKTSFSP